MIPYAEDLLIDAGAIERLFELVHGKDGGAEEKKNSKEAQAHSFVERFVMNGCRFLSPPLSFVSATKRCFLLTVRMLWWSARI